MSIPDLVPTIVRVSNKELRRRLFALPMVLQASARKEVVAEWIVECLRDKGHHKTGVVDFFVAISEDDNVKEIAVSIGELEFLLPSMLMLNAKLQQAACNTAVIGAVLNTKLSDRPLAVIVVYFDLALHLGMIWLFTQAVSIVQRDSWGGPVQRNEIIPVFGMVAINMYFSLREFSQMYEMLKLNLFSTYVSDAW